jgi:hypothetical protein
MPAKASLTLSEKTDLPAPAAFDDCDDLLARLEALGARLAEAVPSFSFRVPKPAADELAEMAAAREALSKAVQMFVALQDGLATAFGAVETLQRVLEEKEADQ